MRDWATRYSRQAARMHLTVVSGPSYPQQGAGFISLRSGAPPPECIPRAALERGMERAWASPQDLFGYQSAMGAWDLRALVAEQMHALGCADVDAKNVMLLSGAQQGIDFLARLFINPGDAVALEDPVYPGALQTFDLCAPRYLPIPMRADGLDLDELAAVLRHEQPKFLYIVPTFQNPTGATMPLAQRERLIALARAHDLAIIEDDPYRALRYTGAHVPPLRALDPEVIYLGTFSKTIAPGIRVGWMVMPRALRDKLYAMKEAADINSDRVMQQAVFAMMQTGFFPDHLDRIRVVYAERRAAMLDALHERMPPDVRWSEPEGGFFVWLTLPPGMDVTDVLARGNERGVGIVPGTGCTAMPGGQSGGMRLSFCAQPPDTITEGVRRLAEVIASLRAAPRRQ
ncbi:MAG: PLP-dependent aminotransferase family protein [Thermomicrobia bacterium]|nr:PLP-dependent aminotransferase family protein [Thermomicrobia bacterium]